MQTRIDVWFIELTTDWINHLNQRLITFDYTDYTVVLS